MVKVSLKKRTPRISTSLSVQEKLHQGEKGTGQFYLPKMQRLKTNNRLKLQ